MKAIYGVGFTAEDIDNFTLVVHHNIITAMRSLVQACDDLDISIEALVRKGRRPGFGGANHEIPILPSTCRTKWTSSGRCPTRLWWIKILLCYLRSCGWIRVCRLRTRSGTSFNSMNLPPSASPTCPL